jgi:hypothetical protein
LFAVASTSRPGKVRRVAPIMTGRRRPNGVVRRSEIAPTITGMVMAKRPPTLTATPIAVPWLALGTTWSIWFWITIVVSGCHMKKLPNQKALSAVCLRLPKARSLVGGGACPVAATAVLTPARLSDVAYFGCAGP